MEQYMLIAGIPIGSWILFSLALITIWITIRYPNTDWINKFFDLYYWFNKSYKTRPKKNSNRMTTDFDSQQTVKDNPSEKSGRVLNLLFKRNKTTPINLGQRLCDYLNTTEIKEMLEIQPENKRMTKLRDLVNEFLTLNKLIRNGDVRTTVIDLNLDQHYRLRLKEEKWIVDTE